MDLTSDTQHSHRRELPAIDLGALVQRHAAGFGQVRACGDWSDPCFRRVVGPLLLAFARHAHLLPSAVDALPGSLLDAGLEACSDALLRSATACPGASAQTMPAGAAAATVDRRGDYSARQEAIVLDALSPWVVAAVSRWQVLDRNGDALPLAAQPLSDQLQSGALLRRQPAASMPHYRIKPAAAGPTAPDMRPGTRALGMVLLMRALPAPALLAACATSPPLLDTALALALPGADGTGMAWQPDALPASLSVSQPGCDAVPEPMAIAQQQPLQDAIQALIACGQWTVNARRSRLWHLDGRLYLVWKTAAGELAQQLSVDRASLLPSLVRHGIVVACPAPAPGMQQQTAGALLSIRTPYTEALPVVELADARGWLRCARVSSPDDAGAEHAKPRRVPQAVPRNDAAQGDA